MRLFRIAALASIALVACASDRSDQRDGAAAHPEEASAVDPPAWVWPGDFATGPVVLVADEVRIEGPQGLLNHLVVSQGAGIDYKTTVTRRGLEQHFQVEPPGKAAIRAGLDEWTIAAQRRLVAIERPDLDGPVRVEAAGRASWQRVDGSDRREGPKLSFSAQPTPPGH